MKFGFSDPLLLCRVEVDGTDAAFARVADRGVRSAREARHERDAEVGAVDERAVSCKHHARAVGVLQVVDAVGTADRVVVHAALDVGKCAVLILAGKYEVELDLGVFFTRVEQLESRERVKTDRSACAKIRVALLKKARN